ncbi:16S rRNA (adenine(1518)-N(6)/adenine(1519)-N(6))-dimethyltransferase RsmA [Taylorella equigenitalis]|uniref:Ribosomal RNA small subunit methyltransferase A n=2 Tax=Taylorella equigenitalis TaxID=29575 RepID=I7IIQ8_9BURK|nr:16S rRNA (adenine(1518)-N(6)/adenine(1519)-N(6))-dimethyltransferase RsmA [Taylorella equigenitalis]AFN36367.1 ribosomal RNA small subunit methyltransferase A (dimethyladenosine transferase) [Taylorella equigenitalis ATCC 35865]ASY39769.1 16S rRNA (adenine(1518)-N(6)/adenine(1519)-N(6))-dimethyltransferase [Taylorella equigenitalis]ASY41214.1 16S rRNA (adenine(1518)-N(6)/adenine(1519)-N(6))-dimethyltransferase [Taylorella equigenitalis]WDU49123.1 16S rRNA (adenine(1518)-N(6)/adenine(1519)-N(
MAHQARKRFGQHFLTDQSVPDEIVRKLSLNASDCVVEIGPGLSALTNVLLSKLNHLYVIEIDRDLAAKLRKTHDESKLTVIESDVLDVDFSIFPTPLRIVGNLPYNISSPILFHLLKYADSVVDQHFMLQKEVVDRMVAKPGSSEYGRLSVMLQERYKMHSILDVPPEAFTPPPKVDSAVVKMLPLASDRPKPKSYDVFSKVVQQAFSQRRKMLRGVLKSYDIDWEFLNINEALRAEDLGVDDYIKLSDFILEKRLNKS